MFLLTTNVPTEISKEPKRLGPRGGADHLPPLRTLEDQVDTQNEGNRGFRSKPWPFQKVVAASPGFLVDSAGITEVRNGGGWGSEKGPSPTSPAASWWCLLWGASGPTITCPQDSPWPRQWLGSTLRGDTIASFPGLSARLCSSASCLN